MQTIQEKILFAGCIIVLMTASVLGVIWLRKFMQPKPEAVRTEQYITVQRDAELYEAFVRATMNLPSATNLYQREMSVVNSGQAKPHNKLTGSSWYWYVLRDSDKDKEYLVVTCGTTIAVTKLESRP